MRWIDNAPGWALWLAAGLLTLWCLAADGGLDGALRRLRERAGRRGR